MQPNEVLWLKVPVYEDDFCTSEALAMTEYSILPLLSGMRNVRDNLLTNSDFGSELSDYYYSVSKNIATDLVSDESFRATLTTNVKALIPLMNELILLSEGKASTYIFTQSDLESMISIKDSVAPRLSVKDRMLGEKLWEQFHFDKYASNKKLKWTTSNSKVATVDSKGNVTVVAPRTATIKATAADGSKKKVECKVTVK